MSQDELGDACAGVTAGKCAASAPFAGCHCIFDNSGFPTGTCID